MTGVAARDFTLTLVSGMMPAYAETSQLLPCVQLLEAPVQFQVQFLSYLDLDLLLLGISVDQRPERAAKSD